jgi:hypothetical protein
MLTNILSQFRKFVKSMHQADLDHYISSRNPKTHADVEALIRQYNSDTRSYHFSSYC